MKNTTDEHRCNEKRLKEQEGEDLDVVVHRIQQHLIIDLDVQIYIVHIISQKKREGKSNKSGRTKDPNGVQLEASALDPEGKHNHRTAQTHAHNPAQATTPQETEQDHAKIKL